MREVDRRTRVSRRVFLRGSATAVPAAAIAGAGLGASQAWADGAQNLKPSTMITLVVMARDIYPHDRIADAYYVKAILPFDAVAGSDPKLRGLLEDGVLRLDSDAQDRHQLNYAQVPWEEQRVAILKGIELTAFFKKVHGDLIVSFYNQKELWPKFGYEGASADKGGYIHRGFDDIDWLSQS
jgi:hypothetical protein